MKTIAVFKWKGKLPTDDEVGADPDNFFSEDFGEQWAYQACQPVATALLKSVREKGYPTDVDKPDDGDLGWYFDILHDGERYDLFIMWGVIEDQDYFTIQPGIHRGCLVSLFTRRPSEAAYQPLRKIINEALANIPEVTGVRWLTDREFDECYRLGKPLPPI